MKSYNVTQEKFYPSKSNQYQSTMNNNSTNSYHQTSIEKRPQKMNTFYNTKQANSSSSNTNEVKMSLEFINHNSQQVTKKKQAGA